MWNCFGKYAVVRKVGGKYKLTVMASNDLIFMAMDSKGVERKKREKAQDEVVGEGKLANSISRSKKAIFEMGVCNPWEYFVTLTLDPKKYDRHNLGRFHGELTHWLRNYSARKVGHKIWFLLVPEQHIDGCWHMHGLFSGLPAEFLADFIPGVHPQKLIGKGYKNWPDYAKKFGFCSLAPIQNPEAVACYITKYITKDTARLNMDYGANLYYCSRGLNRSETLHQDFVFTGGIVFDYVDEKCGIKTYDSLEAAMSVFAPASPAQAVEASIAYSEADFVDVSNDPEIARMFASMEQWFKNMDYEELRLETLT